MIKYPADLSQPVENPALVDAIERMASDNSDAAKDAVLAEIQRATYLLAVVADETMIEPGEEDGEGTIAKGKEIEFVIAESDGLQFLPLFTDWKAIADYTGEMAVDGMVMSADEAWKFALQEDAAYDGAVINPGGNALPLGRPMLEFLRSRSQETAN